MKVAFITSEYPPYSPGGAGISSKLIVETLESLGIDVTVYALVNPDSAKQVQSDDSVIALPIKDLPIPGAVSENLSILSSWPDFGQFDVVHVYNVRHLPIVQILSRVPVVSTHNNLMWACIDPIGYLKEGCPPCDRRERLQYAASAGYTGVSRYLRWAIEEVGLTLAKRSDFVTVQTPSMRDILVKCGYDRSKIEVVPNVLDNRFIISNREPSYSERTLLYVGRFAPEKGPLTVVRAFQNLSESLRSNWQLHMYGSGPLEDDIACLIKDSEDISLRYADYANLPEVYAGADGLVHAAKWPEPFSRTWMEAACSYTPIISSDNPSARDVLKQNAMFFDPFSQESVNKQLTRFLTDKKKRDELAQRARNDVTSYHPENVVHKYVNVYKRVSR